MKALRCYVSNIAAASLMLASFLATSEANAAYTVTVSQVGPNVVAIGSGTINLTALGPPGSANDGGDVWPSSGVLTSGPQAAVDSYLTGNGGPTSFGSGGQVLTGSNSGDTVGIIAQGAIYVPHLYASGASLNSSSTWNATTIAALGLTPGTYTWILGSGVNTDSFTLIISSTSSVPTLSEWGMLFLVGLMSLAGLSRLAQRRKV